MWNHLPTLLSRPRILAMLLAGTMTGLYAQHPGQAPTLTETGTTTKETFPKWSVGASLQVPFRKPQDRLVDQVVIMHYMTDPAIYDRIFNHLGGDFYVGTPDPPLISYVPLSAGPLLLPGVGLTYRHSGFMESYLRAHYYRTAFHGDFPITVSSQDPIDTPHVVDGSIAIRTQGLLLDLGLLAVLAPGKVRPFVRSGVRGQLAIRHEAKLRVQDLTFDWPARADKHVFLPYAGAGLRIELGARLCVDAGLNFGYLPALKWQAHSDIGVGIRF
jgi:hypothetical protein